MAFQSQKKGPCILLNKNINFNKNKMELKMENPPQRRNLCFSSYKNPKLKVKLWWVEARERKKEKIFSTVYFVRREFF